MVQQRIYFDNAATTAVDPRVMEVMSPYFTHHYGNASSLHSQGTFAKDSLENLRSRMASLIGAECEEIIFTGSGTESNNFALKGIAFENRKRGNHILVSAIEHDCVLNTCKWLESQGFYVTYLPVDRFGMVDPATVARYITPKSIMVSVMHANNEVGTLQPLHEIGKICHEKNVLLHSDACQSFGKIPVNVNALDVDLLTLNGHKIYGPKGVGALFIRKGITITPWLHGGGQEKELRSSTENVACIAGFVKAAELCVEEMEIEAERTKKLRDKLLDRILSGCGAAYLNGHPDLRLPNNANIGITGLEGETIRLLLLLDAEGISVSAGSACSSNTKGGGASHVLQALGLDPFQARGSIRISLGRFNSEEEIDLFVDVFLRSLKKLNPIFGA